MSISFWTVVALLPVFYFGWALADPTTVQEIEDHIARKRSAPAYSIWSLRVRNGLGLAVCLLLLAYCISRDNRGTPARDSSVVRPTVVTVAPALPSPPPERSQSLLDRIEGATLQKQIEHHEVMSRNTESPTLGGP